MELRFVITLDIEPDEDEMPGVQKALDDITEDDRRILAHMIEKVIENNWSPTPPRMEGVFISSRLRLLWSWGGDIEVEGE